MQPLNETEPHWYVMRVYKNEKTAEERLSADGGLTYFIPKEQRLRTYHGKKVLCSVPVIHSLVFVHATHRDIVDFKRNSYNDLQFVVWERDGASRYLTVPDGQMENFMRACNQQAVEVSYFKPGEVALSAGTKVRVHGGPLDGVEGVFVKMAGKRRKQVVVILLDLLAIRAEVDPEYLEIID